MFAQHPDLFIRLIALLVVGILEIVALCQHIDGMLFATAMGLIGLCAGVSPAAIIKLVASTKEKK